MVLKPEEIPEHMKKRSDGYSEGFEPLESLDLSKIKDADEMLAAMSKTSFAGRNLGEAADVLYEMITDPDCFWSAPLPGP